MHHARTIPGKSRPRDDDDDDEDEEEEKPKPKKKPKAKPIKRKDGDEEEGEEEKKPRAKKPVPRRKDEVDDDNEEEEEEEEEAPIKWTKRKRQLHVTNIALLFNLVAFWIMFGYFCLDSISLLLILVAIAAPLMAYYALEVIIYVVLGLAGIGFLCQCVTWAMCLFAPAKAETRVPAVTAMGFLLTPVLLYSTYFILSWTEAFRSELIGQRFNEMVLLGTIVSVLTSFFFGMTVIKNIAVFMKQPQLSNQPVSLGWFVIGGIVMRALIDIVARALTKDHSTIALAIHGIPLLIYFFVLRSLYELTKVIQQLRRSIDKFIRDEA